MRLPNNLTEYVAQLNRRLRVPTTRERAGYEAGLIALLLGDAERALAIWAHVDTAPEVSARVTAALRGAPSPPTSPVHVPAWRSDLEQVLRACQNNDPWTRRTRLAWWYRTTNNHLEDLALLLHWQPVLEALVAGDLAPALRAGEAIGGLLEVAATMRAGDETLIPGVDNWRTLLEGHGPLRAPATEDEIQGVEKRLGLRFSASYRGFVLTTNGFAPAGLRPVTEAGWFRIEFPESVDMFHVEEEPSVPDEDYFVYGPTQDCALFRPEYLRTAVVIGESAGDKALLLNPAVTGTGGEMEAWDFNLWLPTADRFPSFRELVIQRLTA